jgi:hypothetical protein
MANNASQASDDVVARLQAANEANARLQAENARLQAENARIQALANEENARIQALADGTYYAALDNVFEPVTVPPARYKEAVVFTRLIRRRRPSFATRSATGQPGPNVYTETQRGVYARERVAAISSGRSSMRADDANAIFPTDIFRNAPAGVDLAHRRTLML